MLSRSLGLRIAGDSRHLGPWWERALSNFRLDLLEGAHHVEPLALEALVGRLGASLQQHQRLPMVL